MLKLNTVPERYRHWHVKIDGIVAFLILDVDEDSGIFDRSEERRVGKEC